MLPLLRNHNVVPPLRVSLPSERKFPTNAKTLTDGTTPSGISESATDAALAATSSKAAAAAAGSVAMLSQGLVTGIAASGLVIVSTLFTLLA